MLDTKTDQATTLAMLVCDYINTPRDGNEDILRHRKLLKEMSEVSNSILNIGEVNPNPIKWVENAADFNFSESYMQKIYGLFKLANEVGFDDFLKLIKTKNITINI